MSSTISYGKPILARRYNVEVLKNEQVISTYLYVGKGKATQIRKEAQLQGCFTKIVEDVTIGRDGNEIIFHEPIPAPIPTKNPPATALLTPEREEYVKRLKRADVYPNPEKVAYLLMVDKEGFTVYRKNGALFARGLKDEVARKLFHEVNSGRATSIEDFTIKYNGKVGNEDGDML